MTTIQKSLAFLLVTGSVAFFSAAATIPENELTSREKELFSHFNGKVKLEASKTKKGIDRSALPLAAMKSSSNEFLETHGPHAGKTFVRTVKKTDTYPKTWPISEKGAVTDTLPGDYVYYQILDKERGLITPLELDLHATIQGAYTPGVMMVPISGKVAPYKIKVKVYDLTNPNSVKHTGEFHASATDRGQWIVSTPAGEFECVMYTLEFDGRVGPASVKDTALVFVNPEFGVIARVTRNKVSACLIYNTDDRFAYVLNKKPSK